MVSEYCRYANGRVTRGPPGEDAHRADRCRRGAVHREGLPRDLAGRGRRRRRLHEGRRLLELLLQGGPVLRRLRAAGRGPPRARRRAGRRGRRRRGGAPARRRRGRRTTPPPGRRLDGGLPRVLDARGAPSRAPGALRGAARAGGRAVRVRGGAVRVPARRRAADPARPARHGDVRDGERDRARAPHQPGGGRLGPADPAGRAAVRGAGGRPKRSLTMDFSYERKRLTEAARGLAQAGASAPRARWPAERRRASQQQRLEALARHAVEHSRFWRERLRAAPVHLAALAVLDKATLMEHFEDMVCDRRLRRDELLAHLDGLDRDALYLGRYRVMTSSGSSGRKALFVYDRAGWAGIATEWFRHCAMTGKLPRLPRRRLVFVGGGAPTHMSRRGGATVGTLYRMCGLGVAMPLPTLVEALNAFRPELMVVYPSVGALLAEEQLRGRLRISVRGITTASELCTPQMSERMLEGFGVRPQELYGTTEGLYGSGCEHDCGIHLFDDLTIVENVDEEGRPVPDGERGARLLVTNLYNRVLPLFRFELSDVATLDSEPCACGRGSRRMTTLHGRADDVLYLPGGEGRVAVHPLQFDVVTADRAVREFQIVQQGPRLLVRVALREDAAPGEAGERLRERVSERLATLGVRETVVVVEPCDGIPRVGGGKLQMVVADRGATNGRAAA